MHAPEVIQSNPLKELVEMMKGGCRVFPLPSSSNAAHHKTSRNSTIQDSRHMQDAFLEDRWDKTVCAQIKTFLLLQVETIILGRYEV